MASLMNSLNNMMGSKSEDEKKTEYGAQNGTVVNSLVGGRRHRRKTRSHKRKTRTHRRGHRGGGGVAPFSAQGGVAGSAGSVKTGGRRRRRKGHSRRKSRRGGR
mgnify:CR=1 FL=1